MYMLKTLSIKGGKSKQKIKGFVSIRLRNYYTNG